jgi:parvulin-like peptidyl-prolyl isomerase
MIRMDVPKVEFSNLGATRYPDGMKYLFLLLGAVTAWGQQAPPGDPVVLTIGSEKITKSQFEDILSTLPQQQRTLGQTPAGRRQLAERLAELEALAQEAKQRKIDQSAKVQTQLKLQADQVLANLVFQDLANSTKPDEASLHAYYDGHKQEWEQVKAKHILIRMKGSPVPVRPDQKDLTDEEALAKAQGLREKIVAGGDFAAIAKAESDDTGTGQNGGDLGSFPKGQMVPEFDKAVFALEPGKLSEPVKTQFGYHLIMVSSHDAKAFDDVRGDIEQQMKPQLAQKGLEELKKKTPVSYNEEYFGK